MEDDRKKVFSGNNCDYPTVIFHKKKQIIMHSYWLKSSGQSFFAKCSSDDMANKIVEIKNVADGSFVCRYDYVELIIVLDFLVYTSHNVEE